MDIYSAGLLGLILGYFGLISFGIFESLKLAQSLLKNSGEGGLNSGLCLVLVFILCLVVTQLVRRLVNDIAGLVTPRHDFHDSHNGILLEQEKHPEIYKLVAEVAQRVGAPMPDEIQVSHLAACYVCEERSFSWRTKRRLVLVLGMPHLSVLSSKELKVILAHELAHFRCGDTTLRVFLFRFLESLKTASKEFGGSWVNPISWFCRGYLHLFLFLSAPVRREQEFRADRLSAEAYGGELATQTLLEEWLLEGQFHAAVAEYSLAYGNLYDWFVARWANFSAQGHDYLLRRLSEEEVGSILDSHPGVAARAKRMQSYPPQEETGREPSGSLLNSAFPQLAQRLQARLLATAEV